MKLEFSCERLTKNVLTLNFMEISPLGAELLQVNVCTDLKLFSILQMLLQTDGFFRWHFV